jgi:hypothetical protein
MFATPAPPSIDVWHQHLAHTSVKKIHKIASLEMEDGLILPNHDVSVNQPCTGWLCGKMQRSKFKLGRKRATQIGQLFHSDVCGPMHIATPRERSVQSDMYEAVKQLLSDLMINSHIPVTPISESSTPSSPLHIDNNLLDSIIHPEYSQHADPSTADTEHPNRIPSVQETHNPNPTHPILSSSNLSRNEPDTEPPSDHIRYSKYALRFREPKRQWDE